MQQTLLSQVLRRWGAVAVTGTIIVTSAGMVGVAYAAEESPAAVQEQAIGPGGRGQFGPGAAQDGMGGRAIEVGRRIAKAFAVQGEVTAIDGDTLTVEFDRPEPRWGSAVTHEATVTVDDESILLDGDFATLDADEIEVGDAVVIVPRMVWGTPAVGLLYQGDAETLMDSVYMGELTEIDGDTLTLTNAITEEEVTVVADEDTIWVDRGEQGRPDELAEGLRLRVLGVEEDGVVRAIVITPALLQF